MLVDVSVELNRSGSNEEDIYINVMRMTMKMTKTGPYRFMIMMK